MTEETVIVCVTKDMGHVPESVLMLCSMCPTEVWVCPWNIGKKLVCLKCFTKLLKEAGDVSVGIQLQDALRAFTAVQELNEQNES